MFTASELPRIARCIASASLERHALPENDDSRIGTLVHRARETGELPDDDEIAAICQRITEVHPEGNWRSEVAFAYDVAADAARELGANIDRQYAAYGATPEEICGTVDALAVEGDCVRIVDYKTGWRYVGPHGWQMKFLALAAARAFGASKVEIIVLTAHRDDAHTESETFDVMDLDSVAVELAQLVRDTKAPAAPVPGDWCRYCPALQSCPTALGIIVALAHGDASRTVQPGDAEKAYNILKSAKAGVLRLEAQLKTLAQQRPIPIGDGQVYGPSVSRQWKFKDGAADAIYNMIGTDAVGAVSKSLSTTSLNRAIGRARTEEVITKLQAMGLAESVAVEKMTEHRQDG